MKTENDLIDEVMSANDLLVVALFDGWKFDPEKWESPSVWIEKFIDGQNHSIQVRRPDKTFVSSYPTLKYQTSWDHLMPVVEKIEGMTNVSVVIKKSRCRILVGKKVFTCHTIVKINSMYRVVVEFIKWHNAPK